MAPIRRRAAAWVASLALAGSAAAAERKPPEAELGKHRPTAPDASLAGSIEAKKPAAEAGPRLEFDLFRYSVELQVSGKRREEMRDLAKLIQYGEKSKEMPSWLFRLAELHWEEAQYAFFEANRKDDDLAALGAKPDPRAVERIRAEKKQLEARSRDEQLEAIRLYRRIVKEFDHWPRLDEVIFFLGENLWRQQRRKEALEAYRALIQRFPKSRYVPDAWMAFGEFYFDSAEKQARNENLKKALQSYKRAAAHTESTVYGFALYKQGWVHFNLGAWGEALDLFRAVVLFGELPTSTIASEKKIALVREAKKDYVRTYSRIGAAASAMEDFKRIGGDGWRDMLKNLAGIYFDDGKDLEATVIHGQLIQADPRAPDVPLFQSRIVTSAGRLGRKDLAVKQAQAFVKILHDIETLSSARDEKGKKALEDARREAENVLRTLAVSYHQEWRKTREEPVAGWAAEVYGVYLQVFPNSPHAYDMRFFHAELLFALEKWQAAGDGYSRVAAIDAERAAKKPPAPGKYFIPALEGAVHAYDVVSKRAEGGRRPAGGAAQKLSLAPEKRQLVDACLAYLKWAPAGEKRVEIAYKAADVYYRHNHFPEAVKLFSPIALEHPRHELAAFAANLTLDCFNLQGDWQGMNDWAKRFWGQAELLRAHPSLKDDLARVIEQSAFKVVERMEKERRHAEAAEAYLAFARDWPGSTLASTALFNASVDLAAAGQAARALEVRDRLLARYPNDPLAAKVVFANAQDYAAGADFEKAADAYERYFAGWRKQQGIALAPARAARGKKKPPPPAPAKPAAGLYEEARARDALYDAGVFREGLSQYQKAEADRLLFVDTWPTAQETPRVFLSLADLAARTGSRTVEVQRLEEYQRRWATAPEEWLGVQARIARSWERAGNKEAARKARVAALAWYRQQKLTPEKAGERGMPAVAEAMLAEIEPGFAAWDRITLDVKPKFLKSQLEVKGKKLLDLEKQYGAVVQLKQAEAAVCALERIGRLYERFARSLLDAPVPKELRVRRELVEEYKAQLAQLAEAPRAKSVEGMEIAVAKSRELGVRNDCARAAEVLLVKAKPDKYGPVLERIPAIAPPAARDRPAGHGLATAPQKHEAKPAAAAPVLRPLAAPAAAAEPSAHPDAPPRPTSRDDRPPIPQKGDEDEDLLR